MQRKSINLLLAFIMLGAIVLTWAKTSQAALEVVEQAIEVTPGRIQWPTYDQGQLIVRPCVGCDSVTLRASEQTIYLLGFSGSPVSRQDMIREATGGSGYNDRVISVFFLPEGLKLTRVVLERSPR